MPLVPDVVALAAIESQWGNRLRDQSIAVFTTLAERSAQLAVPTDGRVCYVADIDQMFVGTAGVWRAVAHDACPYGMTIGGMQIGGRPAGDEGGQINFNPPTNFGTFYWIIDSYRDQLRFYASGKGNPLTLFEQTVHANGDLVVHNGIQNLRGKIDLISNSSADTRIISQHGDADIRLESAQKIIALGNNGIDLYTGGPAQPIRFISMTGGLLMQVYESISQANVYMDLPTLTTGNVVTITPGGQLGRSPYPITQVATALTSLEARTATVVDGSLEDRVTALEHRLDALEARMTALEA